MRLYEFQAELNLSSTQLYNWIQFEWIELTLLQSNMCLYDTQFQLNADSICHINVVNMDCCHILPPPLPSMPIDVKNNTFGISWELMVLFLSKKHPNSFYMKNFCRFLKMENKFIDIGANLTDSMFQGIYGGSQKHQPDLDLVLNRAWEHGLSKMIITVGTVSEADSALKLAEKDDRLFVTMGCHPTRCNDFVTDPEEYYSELCKKIEENDKKVVAIGECGLDYDRLHFCEKDVQKQYFEKQLNLAEKYKLPLFLHCRNSHKDFMEIIERNKEKVLPSGGVVHSFDGTLEEAQHIIDFGFYIGINGCSLKTKENLETVKEIPNDKIMIETDSPWCGIRASHAGSKFIQTKFPVVKKKEKWSPTTLIDSRNEPCQIIQVLEVIAGIKEESMEKLADTFYNNSMQLFFKKYDSMNNAKIN